MQTITHFAPMVRSLAAGFTQNPETREDLVQEGLIKILKIQKKNPSADFTSEDWRRRIYVMIKNCMIDHVRKSSRRDKFHCETDQESEPQHRDTRAPSQFEVLAGNYAVDELMRLLPELERRVLRELLDPSDEFRFFVRKKRALRNITKGHIKYLPTSDKNDFQDLTLSEFLGINPIRFHEAIVNIREVASENCLYYW